MFSLLQKFVCVDWVFDARYLCSLRMLATYVGWNIVRIAFILELVFFSAGGQTSCAYGHQKRSMSSERPSRRTELAFCLQRMSHRTNRGCGALANLKCETVLWLLNSDVAMHTLCAYTYSYIIYIHTRAAFRNHLCPFSSGESGRGGGQDGDCQSEWQRAPDVALLSEVDYCSGLTNSQHYDHIFRSIRHLQYTSK